MRHLPLVLLATLGAAACGGRGLGNGNDNQTADAAVTPDGAPTPDGALPPDGAPPTDAGACVEGGSTMLRSTAIATISLLQDGVTEEGKTVRLAAGLELGGCERLADVSYAVDEEAKEVVLTARRWVDVTPDGICDGELAWYQEILSLSGLRAGTWTARDGLTGPTGALATFEVSTCLGDFDCFCAPGSQPDPVPEGGECTYDCNCEAGLTCQGTYGFDMLHWTCARSCSVDADCAGWEWCLFAADGPYGQCYPADDLPADCSTVDCAPGYGCVAQAGKGAWCQVDVSLWGSGDLCVDDCDCAPGLACVDAGAGESAACALGCRGDLDCPVGAICGQWSQAPASLPLCYLLDY